MSGKKKEEVYLLAIGAVRRGGLRGWSATEMRVRLDWVGFGGEEENMEIHS